MERSVSGLPIFCSLCCVRLYFLLIYVALCDVCVHACVCCECGVNLVRFCFLFCILMFYFCLKKCVCTKTQGRNLYILWYLMSVNISYIMFLVAHILWAFFPKVSQFSRIDITVLPHLSVFLFVGSLQGTKQQHLRWCLGLRRHSTARGQVAGGHSRRHAVCNIHLWPALAVAACLSTLFSPACIFCFDVWKCVTHFIF